MAMLDEKLRARLRWEWAELVEALGSARFYWTLAATLLGSAVASIAINGILIPADFFSSGTSGTSLLIYYLTGWPIGTVYLVLNIPIFIIGWREYALKYVVLSAAGVLMYSGLLSLTQGVHIPVKDPLMGSVIAGLMIGVGTGFYLRFGGSAGGLDILATYIRKKVGVPIGVTCNAVNGLNLVGALFIFELDKAFYSGLLMWVAAWTMQWLQTGIMQHRAVLIITREHDAAASQIRERLDRGVTFLSATGSYSGAPLQLVYCVINMYELGRLKDIMFRIDPAAYIMVTPTSEVIGARFHSWEQEGYRKVPHED